jgi:hypothetical protein
VWPGVFNRWRFTPCVPLPCGLPPPSTAAAQPQRYLTNDEAADYLRLSPRTLEKQRVIGGGPRFRKFGRRVMYAVADLDTWAADRSFETRPIPSTPSSTRRTAVRADRGARVAFAMSSPSLPCGSGRSQEREQLDLFRALPGDMAPRDSQDLMAFPFFSLAKSRRKRRSTSAQGNVTIRVEGTQEHGIATIWDADVLIWAASQIVEARDAGLRPSRLMQATPYEILRFIGRGTSLRDYQRLKAALDRLQSTTVATSIRETTGGACIASRGSTSGRNWPMLAARRWARTDPAGLVLCWRHRRRPGADHRPGVFPADGRHRAVAVPAGAQARRQAGTRLAVRLPAPVPQIGQRGAVLRLCCRPARAGRAAVLARLQLGIERIGISSELLTFRPVPQTARG